MADTTGFGNVASAANAAAVPVADAAVAGYGIKVMTDGLDDGPAFGPNEPQYVSGSTQPVQDNANAPNGSDVAADVNASTPVHRSLDGTTQPMPGQTPSWTPTREVRFALGFEDNQPLSPKQQEAFNTAIDIVLDRALAGNVQEAGNIILAARKIGEDLAAAQGSDPLDATTSALKMAASDPAAAAQMVAFYTAAMDQRAAAAANPVNGTSATQQPVGGQGSETAPAPVQQGTSAEVTQPSESVLNQPAVANNTNEMALASQQAAGAQGNPSPDMDTVTATNAVQRGNLRLAA